MAAPTPLESSLAAAADDPARRPEFYRKLLESTVFVIGRTSQGSGSGQRVAQSGEKVSIASWQKPDGSQYIPFFGSMASLQSALKTETPYLQLPARSLFELTSGTTLILNPGLPYGKEFLPAEIQALLTTGANKRPETREIRAQTRVQLGQPADYPTKMVDALRALLPRYKAVRAAYLCLMEDPSVGPPPSLVVGIDADADVTKSIPEIGSVAGDTAPSGVPVDFTLLRRGRPGIDAYMLEQVKPFYERKSTWLGRVRRG